MLDRFSDGRENEYKDNEGNLVRSGTTPPYSPAGAENAVKTEADAARAARSGSQICGRDAQGVREQNRYLKRLGVTALSISPIFKQVRFQKTYHSYGTGVRTAIEQSTTYGGTKNV